jgi:hypothetical protein
MKFNKRILVTAVSTALFLNAVDSMAIQNIDPTATASLSYAKELNTLTLTDTAIVAPTPAVGLALGNGTAAGATYATGGILDITGTLSPLVIPSGSQIQLKVTLNGGTFTGNPAVTGPVVASVAAFNLITHAAAGGNDTLTYLSTPALTNIPGWSGYGIDVTSVVAANNSTPLTLTIETSIVSGGGFTVLKTISNLPYVKFENALSFNCTAPTPVGNTVGGYNAVDVTQNALYFSSGLLDLNSTQGTIQLAHTAKLDNLGANTTTAGILASGSVKITNTSGGGWAAFQAAGGVTALNADAALTIAAPDPVISYTAANLTTLNTAQNVVLALTSPNATAIGLGNLNAAFTGVANAGYSAVTGNCPLSPIVKNGSEDRLTVALTPNGAYSGLIRITNPSATAGKVYLTIIDDAGVSTSKTLTQIGGAPIASDTLAAGASTRLINVNELGVATTGKLRIIANGDFGANATAEASASPTAINLQSFSVSKSGDSFSMMGAK